MQLGPLHVTHLAQSALMHLALSLVVQTVVLGACQGKDLFVWCCLLQAQHLSAPQGKHQSVAVHGTTPQPGVLHMHKHVTGILNVLAAELPVYGHAHALLLLLL